MITAEPTSEPAARTGPSGTSGSSSRAGVELPASGTGVRARRRRRERRERLLRRTGFVTVMAVLVVSIPVLGWLGFRKLGSTTAGDEIDPSLGPDDANFQATVEPTPTELLVQLDADERVVSITVAALRADEAGAAGGALLFIPVGTMVEVPSFGLDRLGAAYELGGLPVLQQATANLLGLSFDDVVTLKPERLTELVTPVAPLHIDNPDRIETITSSGRVEVLFPSGPVDLTADQVATYLAARGEDESDLARLVRHQYVWQAWLAAVAASTDPAIVPGEADTGIGRFVRALAAGLVEYDTLPVDTVAGFSGDDEVFQPDRDAIEDLVPTLVPYPTSANPGDRVRVRILNGVGQPGLAQAVTEDLVPAGAEITVVGNADRFSYETTQIVFYVRTQQEAAERMRDALGVGEVVFSRVQNDAIDVTVVVGQDFVLAQSAGTGSGSDTGGDSADTSDTTDTTSSSDSSG